MLPDFLPNAAAGELPLEASLETIAEAADQHKIFTTVWRFAPMRHGEMLQEHVLRQVQLHGTECPGPDSEVRALRDTRPAASELGLTLTSFLK